MACTIAVVRGVGLVHGLLPARQLRPVAVPLERDTHGTAGALIRLVREGHHVSVGQRGDDAVGSRSSQVVCRAGKCRRRPDEASGRIRDYLHVHPVPSVLSGVVRLLIVHAVDWDQRAVEDDVGQQPDPGHRLVQVVGGRGEQGDRLADIAPGGGNPDLESGGQAGEGVAVAQVGQGEQGLPAGVESAPAGSSRGGGCGSGRRGGSAIGWTAGSRQGKTATRLPVGASFLVDCLSYRELA